MKKRKRINWLFIGMLLTSCVYHKIEIEDPVPEETVITFTKNIRPLIISRCGACHNEDGEMDFSIYANTISNIDLILHRVQRNKGATGFMPQDGEPLSITEIRLLQKWQSEGMVK